MAALVALGVLAVLIAGIWLVPGWLDWSRYRAGIAALASERLGRTVRIGGDVTLHLLPQPILTASDVTIGSGEDDRAGIGLHAQALRLRVGLGALLAGNVDARELTLQGAELDLPWPPANGALALRPPSWVTGLEARIEDGRLRVGDLVLRGIGATISTDPDTGTLSIAGTGQTGANGDARDWTFTARLARPGPDGTAGLDMSLDGQGRLRDTGGTFSGTIGADGELQGRVAGRGPNLSALMPAPALPWRGDGRLSASGGLAVADELALEIGDSPARGAVALRVSPAARLDLAIAAGRLDLDAWLPALLARDSSALRAGVPTGIDLSAEAATLAGGTVRRLRAGLDLEAGAMRLRDVSAMLPGEALVALSGAFTGGSPAIVGSGARFEGSVRAAVPDLRATLAWLARGTDLLGPRGTKPADGLPAWLPENVLRAADLTARVTAHAGGFGVTNLAGRLDGSVIGGDVAMRLPGNGLPPKVEGGLTLDRLVLDTWLPVPDRAALPGFPAVRQAGADWLARLRRYESELRLQVKQAEWGGSALGAVTVELQTDAGRVFLRRLEAQPFGMQLSASGQVVAEAGHDSRLVDGRAELSGGDMAALAPFVSALPGGWPALAPLVRSSGRVLVQAAGPAEAITGRVLLEASDLRAELRPTIDTISGRWTGSLMVHHPGAPRLLEAFGMQGPAAWLGDGSLSLVGQLAGAPGRLELDGATLAAGALRVSGRLGVAGRRLTGLLSAESLPLPLVYPRSPEPWSLSWMRGWQASVRLDAAQVLAGLSPVAEDAAATVVLENDVLHVVGLTGRALGGTVTGSISLDAGADPPRLGLRGAAAGLALDGLFGGPLDIVSGQATGSFDVSAEGFSPAAILATLSGTGTAQVRNGVLAGLDLAAANAAMVPVDGGVTGRIATALTGGTTPFSAIDAGFTLTRGLAAIEGTLTSPAGAAGFRGSYDLRGEGLDVRADVRLATEGAPVLGLRISGTGHDVVRTPELVGLARWLAERP